MDSQSAAFFATQSEWRRWLEENHAAARELWVGFYKRESGKPSITWPESVDEALCFGWIDGVRKSIDQTSYTIRFTPRKSGSVWSSVNVKRALELSALGLMHEAGLKAFTHRDETKTQLYSYENRPSQLSAEYEQRFRDNKKAWEFFQVQAPSYRRTTIAWVMSAKQEATRDKRLAILMADSEKGQKIALLMRPPKSAQPSL